MSGRSRTERLSKLRRILIEHFSEGELRILYFDLGVDYDSLPGSGTEEKAHEFVLRLERQGRIAQLLKEGKKRRPHAAWPVVDGGRTKAFVITVTVLLVLGVGIFFFGALLLKEFNTKNQDAQQGMQFSFPSSDRIAFVSDRTGDYEIFIASLDGNLSINMTNHNDDDYNPAWSPDGQDIAFVSARDGYGTCGEDENPCKEIYIMNADGTHPTRLTNTTVDEDVPSWSPDGKKLAFQRKVGEDWEIFVMDVYGGNAGVNLSQNPSWDIFPTWSPDSQRIAFQSYRDGNWNIYVMNSDGTNQTALTFDAADDQGPDWSPDGKHIVFRSRGTPNGNWDIYRINIDGSERKQLTDTLQDEGVPTWSPDGEFIAFQSSDSLQLDIFYMRADGSERKPIITGNADDYWPAWSPREVAP